MHALLLTLLFPLTLLAAPSSASLPEPLNPASFDSSVKENGLWFVEHFSPYCHHCKSFLPTWEKLYSLVDQDAGTEPSGEPVRLRQIDCIANGDLCAKNDVQAYPTLNLYRDGKFVDTFKGSRELDKLREFIKKNQKTEQSTNTASKAPSKPSTVNPDGVSVPLTDKTFAKALEDAGGAAFIKFYAPWCGHCKKMAPAWKAMAARLQNKLLIGEVDCEAYKSLCKAQGIEGFPTLKMYSGGSSTEFSGSRKVEPLTEFAEKAALPGIISIAGSEVPGLLSAEPVLYILLTRQGSESIVGSLEPLVAPLLSQPRVYHITPQSAATDLFKMYSIPDTIPWAIVSLRDGDEKPSSVFLGRTAQLSDESERQAAGEWIQTHTLASFYELDQGSFQTVMNGKAKPLVVIAASPHELSDKVGSRLKEISKKWRLNVGSTGRVGTTSSKEGREVVFSFMDSDRWDKWLKSMYSIPKYSEDAAGKAVGPDGRPLDLDNVKVVIADHDRLIFWSETPDSRPLSLSNSSTLFSTLKAIHEGSLSGKYSENFVERMARRLNIYMTSLENFLIEHPFRAILILIGAAVVFVLILRRMLRDDPYTDYRGAPLTGKAAWEREKGGRLD